MERSFLMKFFGTVCRLGGLIGLAAPLIWAQNPVVTDRPADGLLNRTALQYLVDAQVRRNAPALIVALSAAEASERARAAFALGSVQAREAVPKLLELLQDRSAQVRADAAFALGQSADSTVSAALLSAFSNETDTLVRARILEALGKKGARSSLPEVAALSLPEALRPAQAMSLARYALRGHHHLDAARKLTEWAQDENETLRLQAAYYVSRSRYTGAWKPFADVIRRALMKNFAQEAAMYWVSGLGRLGDPADTPLLIRVAESSPDWRVRVQGVLALGNRLNREEVQMVLVSRLDDPSAHVRLAAAQALARVKTWPPKSHFDPRRAYVFRPDADQRVAGALMPVFAETEPMVIRQWLAHEATLPEARRLGYTALGLATDEASFQALRTAALSADLGLAATALESLKTRWQTQKDTLRAADYLTVMRTILKAPHLQTAFTAAEFLSDARFKPLGAANVLMEAYQQLRLPVDLEVMVQIIDGLAQLKDTTATEWLRNIVAQPNPQLQRAAAKALEVLTGTPVSVTNTVSPPDKMVDWAYLRTLGRAPRWILETNKGTLVAVLDPEQAPLTVQTIAQLTQAGRYDGTVWHRVVANFVVQGGDILHANGNGGPDFAIRSEFTRVPYRRGTLGMASAGKDTEGSQFFFCHSMQPHLDGQYTAFGQLVGDLSALDVLLQGDWLLRARIEPSKP